MKKTEAIRAITKAFTTIRNIETAEDLKREKLSLADYNAARDIFGELSTPGSTAETILENVAELYKRCGFSVKPGTVNYTITTA